MKTYGSFSMAARNFLDAPLQFLHQGGMAVPFDRTGEQAFKRGQLLTAFVVRVVARHLIGEGVVAGESGSEDHTGIVP